MRDPLRIPDAVLLKGDAVSDTVVKNHFFEVNKGDQDAPKKTKPKKEEPQIKTKVFVYGTLKKGLGNHRLLEGQTFIGKAETEPLYRLYNIGPYPCMIAAENGNSIIGEVYEVDANTLIRLDRLEGVPFLYDRANIKLKDGTTAVGYLFQKPVDKYRDSGSSWDGPSYY